MVNKVFLSGVVDGRVEEIGREGMAKRVVFDLRVEHKTRAGVVKRESYRINAWNKCAEYCLQNLATGMRVALQGRLSQRILYVGDRPVTLTEVALNEVLVPKTNDDLAEEAL